MRLTDALSGAGLLACSMVMVLAASARAEPNANLPTGAPAGPAAPGESAADKPKDLLGNMVVVAAAAARPLPKIGVVPSLSPDMEDVTLRSVVRRDLDLCGEFEVLPESAAPDGLYLADSPVDAKAWGEKGAEAVVRVSAKKSGDQVELTGQAFLVKTGDAPVLEKKALVAAAGLRVGAHRMADALIGALTGHGGSFASRLTFASGSGKVRRIYVIDADGNGGKAVSSETDTAIAPAFGKGEELYYAVSKDNGEYRLVQESGKDVALPVKGSVYGVAFSRDRSKVAVSVGMGSAIKLFSGPDLGHVTAASSAPFAMEPAFSPAGKLAFVGLGATGQRVYVDDKPVTPEGVFAQSPTFCNHPDGVRLVFAAGAGTMADLFSTGETGGSVVRLTQDQGKNSSPACSPDGRLVAFFSSRTTGDGPGLYVMRTDGLRPKRISPLTGDSLRWDPLPAEPKPAVAASPVAASPVAASPVAASPVAASPATDPAGAK
jgi:TolB protein